MVAKKTTECPASRSKQDKGMVQRLTDQRKIFQYAKKVHENPRILQERAFYPEHDKRKETPAYKKVHNHLTKELDLPCLVCGVKHSTLNDKIQNRYGAQQMETHHHITEWALANAIDAKKFSKIILPHLKARHSDKEEYQKPEFTDEEYGTGLTMAKIIFGSSAMFTIEQNFSEFMKLVTRYGVQWICFETILRNT